jgi:hypothetical protein
MEGLWPLVILWVLFSIFSGAKKRRPQAPPSGPAPTPGPERAGGGDLLGELRRAMEELKRAEAETQQKQEQRPAMRSQQPKRATRPGTARGQVFLPPQAPRSRQPVRRPVRALEDDDADKTSESDIAEVRDYDSEAEQVVAERRKVADAHSAESAVVSLEDAGYELARKRSSVPEGTPIGGATQHAGWHERTAIGAPAKPVLPTARRNPLARFAGGTARGAVVLAEILGKPLSSRP